MLLQVFILGIVNVLVVVRAKMACQMLLVQMIKESQIVEEELITKVAERMRKNFSKMLIT